MHSNGSFPVWESVYAFSSNFSIKIFLHNFDDWIVFAYDFFFSWLYLKIFFYTFGKSMVFMHYIFPYGISIFCSVKISVGTCNKYNWLFTLYFLIFLCVKILLHKTYIFSVWSFKINWLLFVLNFQLLFNCILRWGRRGPY